jgi:6,7-dimethyl-8-ribityllumazine synthase
MEYDAIIAIGCLIKGETMHFEYICEAVSQGIMRLNTTLSSGSPAPPIIFGVLAVLTEEQARARAGLIAGKHNHGTEWAQSALKMANVYKKQPDYKTVRL